MPDLYPPSTEQSSRELEQVLNQLVHDQVRTDPDSRHYHAYNPIKTMLDQSVQTVRRTDPRPWNADVRQTAAVRGVDITSKQQVTTNEFLFGPPDRIQLVEMERQDVGIAKFRDQNGVEPDLVDLRAVYRPEGLVVQSGGMLYLSRGSGDVQQLQEDVNGTLISSGPGSYGIAEGGQTLEGEVAAQVDGLSVRFAGRGEFQLDIEFTGVTVVDDGDNVLDIDYAIEPLNVLDEDGNAIEYTLSLSSPTLNGVYIEGDTVNIDYDDDSVDGVIGLPGDGYTMYYRGRWTQQYTARGSARLGELPDHSISLSPIAESLYEVPSSDRVSCVQSWDRLARIVMGTNEMDVTTNGYVGNTDVGHDIHSVVHGSHHAVVVGGSQLSVVEPQAAVVHSSFSIPANTVGVTWMESGILAIIVAEGNELVTYAIDEIRDGQADGLTPRPILNTPQQTQQV